MKWVESWVTSGGDTGPSNRITLLRDSKGSGVPDVQSVFLDHLNSPFGVALVGNDLYVANTDAIVRYPYKDGAMKITEPGTTLTPLPGGPIDHHWTKSLVASPDGSKLYVGVGSNSNITENGMEAEKNRADILEGRSRQRGFSYFRQRASQPQRPDVRAAKQGVVDRGQRARRTRPRIWCRIT